MKTLKDYTIEGCEKDVLASRLIDRFEQLLTLEQQLKQYFLKRYSLAVVYDHMVWYAADRREGNHSIIRNPNTKDGHFGSIEELLEWCETNRKFEDK